MAYIASHFIKPSMDLGQNTYRDMITEEELQTFPVAPDIQTNAEDARLVAERQIN